MTIKTLFYRRIKVLGRDSGFECCYPTKQQIINIIIIIIKKGWQCNAGRERLTPYQPGDPSPIVLIHRMKEEKGKQQETKSSRAAIRPFTAPGLGVCEWSPDGLKDKSVSLIPNTVEILKSVKKKMN